MEKLLEAMMNPEAAFKRASQEGQQATIGLLAQSMFQVIDVCMSWEPRCALTCKQIALDGSEYAPASRSCGD